ncbi:hypothetical protein FIBSPDRAFT_961849 [Athelia psychrophila]|uniref:Uncharacterized protein n=1 Tax=Athelia psychrophila TaxID=1759441 RepID=A0A166ASG0_9AGAM|nr:hypothetical protein FIBSPDRAFT_961849 [Fibularhizoctonia sp. CBS 109695]
MAASFIKISTGDLRSAAKEYQRDRNHNAKWARWFAPAPGKTCTPIEVFDENACTDCAVRPNHRDKDLRHNQNKKSTGQKTTFARKVLRNDVFDTGIGSSDSCASQDDIRDAAAAPVPDARLMCDYDALSGPGEGYDTLSHATTAAVQRYENKVTENLAKE